MAIPTDFNPLGSTTEQPFIQPVMTGYASYAESPAPSFGMSISGDDNHYSGYAAWKCFSSYGVSSNGAFACQVWQSNPSNCDITFDQPLKISSIGCHIMSGWGFSGKPNIRVLQGEEYDREVFNQTYSVPSPSDRYEFTPISFELDDPSYSRYWRIQISPALAAITAVRLNATYRV